MPTFVTILGILLISTVSNAQPAGTPYISVVIRIPSGTSLGAVSLNLVDGDVYSSGSTVSLSSLYVQLCGGSASPSASIQMDALVVSSSATVCAPGLVNLSNFLQGSTSVTVSLTSTNDSASFTSPYYAGSYSLSSTAAVITQSGSACTTTASTATLVSGSCGNKGSQSLQISALGAVVFEAFGGCLSTWTGDGPYTYTPPTSPPVSPASTSSFNLNSVSNWKGWGPWGTVPYLNTSSSASGNGVTLTVAAWLGTALWLGQNTPFVYQAGVKSTLTFTMTSSYKAPVLLNATVVFVSGYPEYMWGIQPTDFEPGSQYYLGSQTISGPITNTTGPLTVNWTPTSTGQAYILIRTAMSGVGNVWSFSFTDITLSQSLPTPGTFQTGTSELYIPTVMSSILDPNPRTVSDCPHLQSGLSNWHDPSIWPGGVLPNPANSITVPYGLSVLISSCSLLPSSFVYNRIYVPPNSTLIFSDANIKMRLSNLYVEGQVFIGSPTCRLNANLQFEFVGAATQNDDIATGFGSKGIGVASGGSIDVHGYQYNPTWTRLSTSAVQGTDTIYVIDANNWVVGQTIVIATSAFFDLYEDQNEVRVIKAIDSGGKRIQLDSPLSFYHYGGYEYQCEVGLLSRNIQFSGDEQSDVASFGGHVRVTGEGRFSGLQTYRMGQLNMLGKYPLHFHMIGHAPTSFVRDCSVWNSYFRCVAIHGTNDTQTLRTVVYNATANCFYLEDGVEENNTLAYNLAIKINVIGTPMGGQSQIGDQVYSSADLILPADSAAAGFYITNAYNTFIGNAASGGWSGFSFPNLPAPIGPHRNVPMAPQNRPTKVFYGNTAHSSGYVFPGGGCIYVGGYLAYTSPDSAVLSYNDGRFSRQTQDWTGTLLWMQFNNTKSWRCNMGTSHWGDRIEIVGYESHDTGRAVQVFGDAWFSNALCNAQSANPILYPSTGTPVQMGFQFYDTYVKSLVTRITFRGYNPSNPPYGPSSSNYADNPDGWGDERGFTSLVHSDYYKPQGISATLKITFENSNYSQWTGHKVLDTGSSRYYNFVDWDGSFGNGGNGVPQIIGSGIGWWNYSSACIYEPSWYSWRCPQGNRTIVNMLYLIPGFLEDVGDLGTGQENWIGQTYLWGPGIMPGQNATLTLNPGVTGISQAGWYFYTNNGSPQQFQLYQSVNPTGQWVMGAWSYGSGSTFSIVIHNNWGYNPVTVTPAATFLDVYNGNGTLYYFDGSHLYIKLVNNQPSLSGLGYTRDGVTIYEVVNAVHYDITVTCTGQNGLWCPASYSHPTQTWP